MLKVGDKVELSIETVANGGEGIARHEGIPVFIDNTVDGDVVSAEIVSVKKSFAKARLLEVLTPSEHRVTPKCGLAKTCGGCNFLHIAYEKQLEIKRDSVKDCLRKFAGIDFPVNNTIHGDNQYNYRCKVQYPVQQTKMSKRFLVGYYKEGSHDIVNIKVCSIQPQIIDKITEFLREELKKYEVTAYNEKKKTGLLRHIVYRYSSTNDNMTVMFVVNAESIPDSIKHVAARLMSEFPQVVGVLANFNKMNSNVILGKDAEVISGQDYIDETVCGLTFRVSASSFFQVNPKVAEKLFTHVRDYLKSNLSVPDILDVYSGGGTFALTLADFANKIVAVEENPSAVSDAEKNVTLNPSIDFRKIDFNQGNADEVLLRLAEDNKKFDAVILDPPRKGCSQAVIEATAQMAKDYIVYVSCNPSTLARDIKALIEKGFELVSAQPFDMFCNTYHVETVAILKRKN